jgi:hypothetical protein
MTEDFRLVVSGTVTFRDGAEPDLTDSRLGILVKRIIPCGPEYTLTELETSGESLAFSIALPIIPDEALGNLYLFARLTTNSGRFVTSPPHILPRQRNTPPTNIIIVLRAE